MAEQYRSSVFAANEESTEGTLATAAAADFIPIREGFTFEGRLETVQSTELIDAIAPTKSYTAKEAPRGTLPVYIRHSGTEGTAPEIAVLIKSCIGSQTDNGTEYSTSGTSVAGTATTRGHLEMGSDQEDNFLEGQAVLIKDATNGYSVRNVYNVDSAGNQLDLNFNVGTAPATGTALGKANHFRAAETGHVTYSAFHFQASSSSAFQQAMAGCRTTSMSMNFPANGLAEATFEFEGIQFFFNPITVTASSNDSLDFNDGGGEENATLTAKTYNNPHEVAREVADRMNDLTTDTISCSFSDTTGKFTISTDGGTLSLLWNTGANTGTTCGNSVLGFTVGADDTGATTYTGDSAITYDVPATPSYDGQDSIVVKHSEILIGAFGDTDCRPVTNASFTIATPKVDIPSICAVSGIDSSLVSSRLATFSCTMALEQHEAGLFDKFINNTDTAVMFNTGEKDGNNWTAGTVLNVYMPQASIQAIPVLEQDGYVVFSIEATAHVNTTNKDIHINFL